MNRVKKIIFDDEGRMVVWSQTLKDYKQKSLTGYGLGSYEYVEGRRLLDVMKYSKPTVWKNPHNEYLRILFETGAIGLGLFLMFCFSIFRKFIRSKKSPQTITLTAVLVAFLINCIGLFPMEISCTAYLSVIIVGLLMNLLNREEIC